MRAVWTTHWESQAASYTLDDEVLDLPGRDRFAESLSRDSPIDEVKGHKGYAQCSRCRLAYGGPDPSAQ